jgi:hypothetical protein
LGHDRLNVAIQAANGGSWRSSAAARNTFSSVSMNFVAGMIAGGFVGRPLSVCA